MSNQKYDNRSPQKPSFKRSNIKDLCNTTTDSDNSRSRIAITVLILNPISPVVHKGAHPQLVQVVVKVCPNG